jgi:hypothetical protein
MNIEQLAIAMLQCEQTKNQTVFQHGISVFNYFTNLVENETDNWKIPLWFEENKKELLDNIYDLETISLYTRFHDCGKPFCREVDSDGKVHFPNHAEISKKMFFEATSNTIVSNLIGWDMCLHQDSSIEIQKKLENVWSKKDAYTLLLVSLCEIHSNASMFGGIDSISFKSKWKKIDQRGKQIIKYYLKS